MKEKKIDGTLPVKLAKPAQRALQHAGISSLKQFSHFTEEEISQLHGIGKNALNEIKEAMKQNGVFFRVNKIARKD